MNEKIYKLTIEHSEGTIFDEESTTRYYKTLDGAKKNYDKAIKHTKSKYDKTYPKESISIEEYHFNKDEMTDARIMGTSIESELDEEDFWDCSYIYICEVEVIDD